LSDINKYKFDYIYTDLIVRVLIIINTLVSQ